MHEPLFLLYTLFEDSDLNAYPLPMRLPLLPALPALNYCTCAYFFLLYPEDSLNWHCDYRYIANRKKYSQAGEVGEERNSIYRLFTNDRRPERGIER